MKNAPSQVLRDLAYVLAGLIRIGFRKAMCSMGRCMSCTTNGDEFFVWGECIDCGKRHGILERSDIP